jgi:hypothetical protein
MALERICFRSDLSQEPGLILRAVLTKDSLLLIGNPPIQKLRRPAGSTRHKFSI